jgi:hypothetical protein
MQNKYNFMAKPLTSRDRLSEVGSLLTVAIARLMIRESQKNSKTGDFLLDSNR